MARCCGGASCACVIEAGDRISVDGIGSSQDPFVISADLGVAVLDTTQFDLVLTGSGTAADPYTFSVDYAATATLGGLPDVSATPATNGQVLAYNTATNLWEPTAPTVAPTGAVTTTTAFDGDGSPGDPLAIVASNSYLGTSASGFGFTVTGFNRVVVHYANEAARIATTITPQLNGLSMLDDAPGVIDYWDGVAWVPAKGKIDVDADSFMEMSGAYDDSLPLTLLIRNIDFLTAADGTFNALTVADLTGYAGVVSVSIQPTGTLPYSAVLTDAGTYVAATAYDSEGVAYASQSLSGCVTAYVY